MKVDIYTKTVLTVIAGALLYLCSHTGQATVVQAQGSGTIIAGWIDSGGQQHTLPAPRSGGGATPSPLPVSPANYISQ